MPELVRWEGEDGVAILTLDNPPVNTVSRGAAEALLDAVTRANDDPTITAIVVTGSGRCFAAGADISEFSKPSAREYLGLLLACVAAVENSPKPVVMAIHGMALGAGLELAMAGHYRLIAPTAEVGQPEVKLGLIPGAGGTQRLPRLAGIAKALDMCVSATPVNAREALTCGIVDAILEGDLLAGALAFAREIAGQPIRRTCERAVVPVEPDVFAAARARARKKMRGQSAPLAVIEALAAAPLPFAEGMRLETELFKECLRSPQSHALIYAFFAERATTKIPGLPRDASAREIRRAGVIGAGTMGGGIAMALANAGIPVRIKETTREALDRGLNNIRRNYGRLTPEVRAQRLALITPQLDWKGFEQADIVIEAVFENLSVKQQVFGELDRVARPGCILATNTSSLDIDAIAAATTRPADVIGLHFFSPAQVMRLLEIVRGQHTAADVLATVLALGKKLGKVGVLAGNCRGFIGNRMIHVYAREAQFLVEEGAPVEEVNAALYDFGMPMGPLAMCDLVGNDVMVQIAEVTCQSDAPGPRQPLVLPKLVALGRLGQKTGRGWSAYDVNRKASPDAGTTALIATVRLASRTFTPQEIVDRCIFALVNEGARILEEGVALRASDIDVVYLAGYGFPSWRGGPMFYADTMGLARAAARVAEFGWPVAPLLRELASSGKTFTSA